MSTLSVWKGAAHPRRGLQRSQPTLRRTEGFRSVRLCPAIKDRAQWRVYGEPAVGNKKRAGNERRLIRGQEKRCIRHIFRLAQASQMEGLDPRPYNVSCDHRDRKSVVSGKSVSVRVGLGGGRRIKKKKKSRKY